MNQPLVSIIIPAKDAERTIEKCILSLLNLDYQNYEVIIVNDGSQDRTGQTLQKYAQEITVLTNIVSQGPARARNMAAKEAKGDFLAFSDADCVVDRNWLNELLEGFKASPEAVACGGRQEIPEDETVFGRKVFKFMKKAGFLTDYMRKGEGALVLVSHNPSCNVMYRKNVFLQEGGFLAGLWPGEDVELDYRLKKKKFRILFNPKAIVYHYRPENLKSFLKIMFRYGLAQGFLVKKHGLFRPLHFWAVFSPLPLLLLFVGLLLNAYVTLTLFILLLGVALVYFSPLGLLSLFAWLSGFFKALFKIGR